MRKLPLTEKYRPKSIKDVVGNEKQKQKVIQWLNDFFSGKTSKKAILIHGPPGIGKTSFVHALANELDLELIELNASDSRTWSVLKKIVEPASLSSSFFGKRKLILLDEIDGISKKEDQGAEKTILKILQVSKNPIIMVANDAYADAIKNIRQSKLVQLIEFSPPTERQLLKRLKEICENEGLEYEEEALKLLIKKNRGDMRGILNDLESIMAYTNKITVKDVEVIGTREKKDYSIFMTLAKVFKSEKCLGASLALANAYDIDPEEFLLWISENIPVEYEKPEEISRAYEKVSRADMFLGAIKRTQDWKFLKYASFLMSAGVAMAKDKKYYKFTKYRYPSLIMLLFRTKQDRQAVKEIAQKLSKKLHVSTRLAAKEFVPWLRIIAKYNVEKFAELAKFFELTKTDVKNLTKNESIANKVYNLMRKIKEKKEIKEGKKIEKKKKEPKKTEEKKEEKKKESSLLDFF